MSSRASRERARQRRRRVAMAQRLGAIVLMLVLIVALVGIFRGCGKVDEPTLPPAATESSIELASSEELSASSMSYSPEPEETPTYYGDPDNYVYPFNTMSTDWDGSVYDNGFKLYEIPYEYAREGGCFPEVVQVYLWCLCEQRDIDYYMVVALIERESGYKWDATGDGGNSVTDSNLNHTGIYLYSKGKIMIHLTFDYQSDEGCTTPGQYLRYHRTFHGLTTRELAEKVGVVPATLVLYENDRHPIKHSTAVALANVLGIDRSRLLDEYTVFVDYPYSSLLKKVRRELSFTQMQMAEVIGIGQTTYSGWEREVRVPRRKEHEKILAAMKKLKVDVDTYLCQPNPL